MIAQRLLVVALAAVLVSPFGPVRCEARGHATLSVTQSRCEFRQNPLGTDTRQPRLSWIIQSAERAQEPTAYQVVVADRENDLSKDGVALWDSGKIESDDPTHAIYAGPPVASGQRFYWKVRVWGSDGNVSPWSEPAWWEMALVNGGDWKGKWIDDAKRLPQREEEYYDDDPAPLFRKKFDVEKQVKRARLYIAGIGYYEAWLNGQRVGNSMLDPAWTTYSKRVLYSTYDVTAQLQSGRNCLGAMLGNGWYNPLPMRMWGQLNLRDYMCVGRPRLIAQLVIEHLDGTRTVVTTDDSWKTSPGPILRNSVYLGETYDARREMPGWNEADFDDSAWTNAAVVGAPIGELRAQSQPPIRETAVLKAVARTEPKPGVYIFDVGENLAGWIRLRVQGASGTRVRLRYGELLYPDGTLNVMTTVCGQIKEAGVGGPGAPNVAEQSDTYVLCGADGGANVEIYKPRFTYHGFRYVEVTGYPGEPDIDAIEAIRLRTVVESAGSFSCSDDLLNRIQTMCRATFPSNLLGVQTDCPGRERFAYGDDIACACEAHLFNYDMATFYAKTARDFADAARPNGALTLVAPWTGHAIGGFDPGGGSFADVARNGENAGTGAMSGVLAHLLLLQKAYQVYGDRQLVEEQYDVARNSLEFIRKQADGHIIAVGLADWSSVEPTNTSVLDTALYFQHAKIVAGLARIVGRDNDVREYEALAEQIKAAFIRAFLSQDADMVGFNTQAAQACALYHGLVPDAQRAFVADALIDNVLNRHHGHLTTGIFGTKYLLDVLTTAGRPEVAYGVVNQTTYPGWGYMLERGATTLWEVWDFSDNVYSHNHSMFGTVSAWFFTALGGIQPADDAVGFDKIVLRPHVVPGLTWTKVRYRSVRGDVISSWRVKGGEFRWEIAIPPTASAEVYLPTGFTQNVQESSGPAEHANGVELTSTGSGPPVYRVKSGSYVFTSQASVPTKKEK